MSRKHLILAKALDKRGRLIASAHNNYTKSSPLMKHFAKLAGQPDRIFWHAECLAIARCGDKTPHTLIVERFDYEGKPALAKPCKVCTLAIKEYGVKKVRYTYPGGYYEQDVKDL